MKRRRFLKNAALLSSAAVLSSNCSVKNPKFKMGLQLFSVNNEMNDDPLGTLKAVKSMGYEDFEVFGFSPENISYYGIKAPDFKLMLDDLELSVSSGHYGFSPFLEQNQESVTKFVDACIQGALALDSSYITWPWLAPVLRTRDNYKIMAQLLNKIGEQVNDAGLGFAYHNHGFDFHDYDGEVGYDIIVSDTDAELVKLQMDMYWVMHSSDKTPKQLINLHPGRFKMWHIKDMDKVTRDYTELGNGSIEYLSILPDPTLSGLEFYYIEQGGNFTNSPLESAATSAEYFKKNLRKFL